MSLLLLASIVFFVVFTLGVCIGGVLIIWLLIRELINYL